MISTILRNRPKRKAGRPPTMRKGASMRVYLDEYTVSRAIHLGEGNLSAGIRKAVRDCLSNEKSQ